MPRCRATFFIRCKNRFIYTKLIQKSIDKIQNKYYNNTNMQMIIIHATTRKGKDNVQKKRS